MADEDKEIEKNESEKDLLTEDQVWSVINFARELEKAMFSNGGFGNTVYTPDLLNQRLKDISYNPRGADEATLNTALQNPKSSEDFLRSFSENLELTSMPYKRLISYLGNLLSWDYSIYCSNADEKDYKTPAYKKELDKVYDFFDKFNVKQEFNSALKQMLRNDAYFFVFRGPSEGGDKYILQELDNYYCRITGRFDFGMMYDFDMVYFLNPGTDIKLFPSEFAEYVNNMFESRREYIPHISPEERGKIGWVYYQPIPVQLGQVFKLTPEIGARIPYFSGLMSDLILQPLMRLLQKNKTIASCSKIISSEVVLLNRDQKTTLKDSLSISPELLSRFLVLMKSAVGEAIKVSASPLTNTRGISFEPGEDVYNQYLLNSVASSGVNSNLIFTSGARPNQLESSLSLATDEQLMEMAYPIFDNFLEYQLSRITKRFHFKPKLEGTNFFTNRQQRLERLTPLMNMGIILPDKIAAAIGVEPHAFKQMLAEGRVNEFVQNLTPIIMSSQISGEQGAGAPKKSDTEISDSGAQTRADASNLSPTKKGKI